MPSMPVDPITIFRTAEFFYHGNLALGQKIPKAHVYVLPYTVLGALALELYFKCLIAIETGANPPRGHNLKALFDRISEDGQSKIQERFDNPNPAEADWRERCKNPPPNMPEDIDLTFKFEGVLRRSARAFERFRYVYEDTGLPGEFAWEANYIIYCTRLHIIQDHRPEWGRQNTAQSPGALPTSPTQ